MVGGTRDANGVGISPGGQNPYNCGKPALWAR
jgi:hypothetical protein